MHASDRIDARVTIVVALAGAIVVACGRFADFTSDDAYISFRYAYNLAHHGELTFNLGERVEGYTNPLWTLLLAGAAGLGVPLEAAAKVLGVVFALGSLLVLFRWARRLVPEHAALAPLLLALEPCHSSWAHLGLEATLFGFFLLFGFERMSRGTPAATLASSVALACAYLTRPEGALAVLALGLVALVRFARDRDRGLLARAIVPAAAIVGGHLVFRVVYYGDWVPNTFRLKAVTSRETVAAGVAYVWDYLSSSVVLALPVVAAIDLARRRERWSATQLAATVVVAAFVAYVVAIGGDYMAFSRFLAPLSPLLVLALVVTLCRLWPARAIVLGVALLLALVAGGRRVARELAAGEAGFISRLHTMRDYVHDRLLVNAWLRPRVGPGTLATSSAIGVIAWGLLPARVIDARGLTDVWVARHGVREPFRPGHAVFAPDSYLLAQRPHLLLHRYDLARGARRLVGSIERLAIPGYQPVCLHIRAMRSGDWFCLAKRADVALGEIADPPAGMSLPVALYDVDRRRLEWVALADVAPHL